MVLLFIWGKGATTASALGFATTYDDVVMDKVSMKLRICYCTLLFSGHRRLRAFSISFITVRGNKMSTSLFSATVLLSF